MILQETHSTVEIEKIWEHEWGGKIIYSHGTSAARGIAILTSKEIFATISNIFRDEEGRIIILDLIHSNQKLSIAAIYAPNKDSPEFFKKVEKELRNRCEHKIVIGDYNLVLDVDLDRQNTYCNNNKAMEELKNIMDQYMLKDTWREQKVTKREYSWKKKNSWPVKASRIDFALISGGIDQCVKTIQYISSICTDHRAIYIVIDLQPFQRGIGYWKFNVSLLQNSVFIQKMNTEIEATLRSCECKSPKETWEILKKRIKQKSVEFSKQNTTQDKIIIAQLSEKVNQMEETLPLNKEEDDLYEKTKQELEEKSLERIKGVMFRSKVKWYEEGEKNTSYFFSLEKARYNAKTCYKLITEDGLEITNPYHILEEQRRYYRKLYTIDEEVKFTMENSFGIKVSEKNKQVQDQQITKEELATAIKGMNNNKTPGEDGIPIDLYKVFWLKLKDAFHAMVMQNFSEKVLHETARKGILNLIPKPNKDSKYIKNLRPITLLNTDYKIIEKTIANKMLPALEEIIHQDQRGFMKERRISVNIRKMLDIMHQAEKEDLEAVILSLDFVKCFDKCSFAILHGSLDFFGFGKIVREWTKNTV